MSGELRAQVEKRIAALQEEEAKIVKTLAHYDMHLVETRARIEELRWLLGIGAAAEADDVPESAQPQRAPREICAEEIECVWAGQSLPDDESVIATLSAMGGPYNRRTIRAALNIVHARRKQSRVGSTEDGDTRKDGESRSSPDSVPQAADAGSQSGDPLLIPGFLDRRAQAEALGHADR